jgi:hypothetical protein
VLFRLALAASLLLIPAGLVGLSGASLSATSTNPGNTLTAATSFCNGGSQAITARKDAYVDQASADSNFGTGNSLHVQSSALQPSVLGPRRTVIEFDLASIPTFCSVTAATLRLYATSAVGGRTIQALQASASWTETGVTWNNQPATTGAVASGSSGPGLRTWDVTSQVQSMYSGANNGFLLRDSDEGSVTTHLQQYQSREGTPDSQDPELVVTFG